MSWVRMLQVSNDWWKFIQIHQYYLYFTFNLVHNTALEYKLVYMYVFFVFSLLWMRVLVLDSIV